MIGKILESRYRLTEQIGMGGMAIVYKALDLRTGHNVAVKVLRPEFNEDAEFVSRFQREAEAARKMTHYNIVNLLDVGMEGENRYLVMEYVQGKTLKTVIQERGRISSPLACQITIRILSALEHAHRNGIVHRDIKPQNILVHADGHIKVADFGIARIADSATLSKGDMVMGSVHYFSPEQARGEPATAASDLYSTGVVLYEMLTGRVPFDGENPVAVAMQHLHAQPIPIQTFSPDVPPSVVAVCMRAMEKNPALRYHSAREMAADLRAALEERPEPRTVPIDPNVEVRQPKPYLRDEKAPVQTGRHRKSRIRNRRGLRVALSVLTALAAGFGLFFGIQGLLNRYSSTVSVPYVEGMDRDAAVKRLTDLGLTVVERETSSTQYAEGVVINQVPRAGETVQRSREPISLLISAGQLKQEMPSLAGSSLSDAMTLLKSLGLENVIQAQVNSRDQAIDTVVSTSPQPGEPVDATTLITLSVSRGDAIVPDLYRMTLPEAERYVMDSQLTFDPVLNYADTEDRGLHGLVAAQSPQSDAHVTLDQKISLTLFRCEEAVHRVQLEITLPEGSQDTSIRITARAPGSSVDWVIKSYTCSPKPDRKETVPLELPDGRSYTCLVYLDNVMGQPIEIEGTDGV